MQNKKNETEDDEILDDEFDLDDLGDLDDDDADLAAEEWDEFDDEPVDADIEDASTESEDLSAGGSDAAMPQKKTFLQKNFTLIVILIVLIGAGLFYVGTMGGGKTPAPRVQSQETADNGNGGALPAETGDSSLSPDLEPLAAETDLPPMPAPINSESEDSWDLSEDPDLALETGENALTPLPEANSNEDFELAELEIENVPAEMPKPAEELPVVAYEDTSQTGNLEEESFTDIMLEAEEEGLTPAAMTLDNEEPPEPATDELLLTPSDKSGISPAPAAASAVNNKDIERLEQRITELRDLLLEKIEDSDEKISSLSGSVKSLEEKVNKLSQAPAAPTKAAKTTEKAQKPETVAPASEPVATSKQQQATPAAAAPQWTLRSAQPGKAVVSAKGSNDMKNVEIGDSLPGIGKIVAIKLDNGLWTIQGTRGSIRQ